MYMLSCFLAQVDRICPCTFVATPPRAAPRQLACKAMALSSQSTCTLVQSRRHDDGCQEDSIISAAQCILWGLDRLFLGNTLHFMLQKH